VTLPPGFEEVVLVDFEFNGGTHNPRNDGNRPHVVCLVAHELRSGRRFRVWHDQLGSEAPYRSDNKTMFIAFYAAAELSCHLSLGWELPRYVLDFFIEFRRLTNHSGEHQPKAGLLAALDHFRLDSIETQAKEHWRDVVLRGGPWTEQERDGILDYCESDVDALRKLFDVMPIQNLGHSLIHGSYMRADAWMRHRGIPLDRGLCLDLATHWDALRSELVDDLNTRYPFFEGASLRQKLLKGWLVQHDVRYWPLTPTGQLAMDAESLRAMAQRCPEVAEFCYSKITLNQLKSFELSVGDDGRNRCMLSAFASKTSRNQPSNSAFVFGLNAAFRSLIKPEPGQALVYLDFSGQEFAEAAYFSRDSTMIEAYESGDPYADWARKANAMPPDGDKRSHPQVRAVYKLASLGVLYGMGAETLSSYVGVSTGRARALLKSHHETFPRFWHWIDAVENAAISTRELQTVLGWRMRVLPHAKPGTLANFPMQANGAEMLRLACCHAVNRDVPIVAPIHDAVLIEGPASNIDDIAHEMQRCMVEASRVVLGGPAVRVDMSKPLTFPHRYVDGRDGSIELWDTTLRLLDRLKRRGKIA
jgi:DNA polymerase-1